VMEISGEGVATDAGVSTGGATCVATAGAMQAIKNMMQGRLTTERSLGCVMGHLPIDMSTFQGRSPICAKSTICISHLLGTGRQLGTGTNLFYDAITGKETATRNFTPTGIHS